MKYSILFFIILIIIILSSGVYSQTVYTKCNNEFKVFSVDGKQFRRYVIPNKELSPKEEVKVLKDKNKAIRMHRFKRLQHEKELKRLLNKKSRRWFRVINNENFFGYDEELDGRVDFNLRWKDI
jgi:hypothetical protein